MKTWLCFAGLLVVSAASPGADKPLQLKPGLPISAQNTDNNEACATLASAIDASEADIAWSRASGIADNSAPRETTRLLSRLLEREKQTQHLMMMIALKCPNLPIKGLNDGQRYYSSALKCQNALLSQRAGDSSIPEVCQRKNWQEDPPKAKDQ